MGTFFLALDTKAAATIEEAGLDQMIDIKVRFRPTKEFASKIRKAEVKLDGIFRLVGAEKKLYEKVLQPKPKAGKKPYKRRPIRPQLPSSNSFLIEQ